MKKVLNNSSVSIVIPTYNGKSLLEKHLPAVSKSTRYAHDLGINCQIIVVDDASSDGTVWFLRDNYPEIKLVRLESNKRFAVACNTGVTEASGKIVVLLNNDVSPEFDFLPVLIEPFTDKSVFAVGCKELDDKGIESGRSGGDFRRGMFRHWRCLNQTRDLTLWATGGSSAFRKSMWRELGGMDERFRPAYEEDRDICYRALKRGWKVGFSTISLVHHLHETTNAKVFGVAMMKTASYKNSLLFVWKNISDRDLIIQHLYWLPYHLVFSGYKTRGLFFFGFIWGLWYLPSILLSRWKEAKYIKLSDNKVITKYGSCRENTINN